MNNTHFKGISVGNIISISTLALTIAALPTGASADMLSDAISGAKPLFNVRLRYETVDQASFIEDAKSLTFRLRAGLETAPVYDTVVGVEFEWVESINGAYNSTTNGNTQFPVVADPQDVELNQLYFQNKSIEDTVITIGRQRIVYDDARFIGDVVWRQNQQTYDALGVSSTAIENLTVNAAYVWQTNRIFGPDSVMSPWDTNNIFLNAGYKTPFGTFTGFAYLLDIADALTLSSKTFGLRFTGSQPVGGAKLNYAASYATQSDYADNPIEYTADYYTAKVNGVYSGFMLGAGYEVLSSDNGIKGFATPLSTAHKFQGFADVFLATPNTGVQDLYVKAGYSAKNVGPFSAVGGTVIYHDFDADFGGANYGDEIDFVASAKWDKFTFLVKYGEYNANDFSVDIRRLTFDINFAY